MLSPRCLISSLVFTCLCATSSFGQSLESRFETFLSWWPGIYDNAHQADASNAEAPMPTRLFLREIDLPAFGDHVVYGEWQALEDPNRVVRQRFYGFEIDHERQSLRLKLNVFPPDPDFVARTRGAHEDPSRVSHVTPDDMLSLGMCDVFFTWTGDKFEGSMDRGACTFPAPGTDIQVYSWSQMRLTDTTFEYLDGWYHMDGSAYRRMSNEWYVFKRD